jgi:hypothetical protein
MRDLVVDLRQLRESITSSETVSRAVEPTRESVTGWWQRPPVWIGATALAAAIAAGTMWSMRRSGEAPTSLLSDAAARPAVAVVPFEVIGGSRDVAWLAKGLPSMLITGLAQTPDIEVVGNERLGDAADKSEHRRSMRSLARSSPRSRAALVPASLSTAPLFRRARTFGSMRVWRISQRGPSDWRRPCVGPTPWP